MNHFAMDIGQTHIPTTEPKRQFGMIHPQQMGHRRMEVVHFHFVFNRLITKFIGLTIGDTGL